MFIVIEGIDGSGKTTFAKILVQGLNEAGIPAIYTREPGGCLAAEEIRRLAMSRMIDCPMTELMLMKAARNENVTQVILPAIDTGKTVVCDRYIPSTYIYQCHTPRLTELVDYMVDAEMFPKPDLMLITGLDPYQAHARILARNEPLSKFESEAKLERAAILYKKLLTTKGKRLATRIEYMPEIESVNIQKYIDMCKAHHEKI